MCLVGNSGGKTTTCGSPSQEWGLQAELQGMGPVRSTSQGLEILGVSFGSCLRHRLCRFLSKILLFMLWVSRWRFASNIQETPEIGNTIGWFLFPSQSLKNPPISAFKCCCCCWACKLPSSQEHNVLSLLLALHWQLMGLFAQPRQPLEQQ